MVQTVKSARYSGEKQGRRTDARAAKRRSVYLLFFCPDCNCTRRSSRVGKMKIDGFSFSLPPQLPIASRKPTHCVLYTYILYVYCMLFVFLTCCKRCAVQHCTQCNVTWRPSCSSCCYFAHVFACAYFYSAPFTSSSLSLCVCLDQLCWIAQTQGTRARYPRRLFHLRCRQ